MPILKMVKPGGTAMRISPEIVMPSFVAQVCLHGFPGRCSWGKNSSCSDPGFHSVMRLSGCEVLVYIGEDIFPDNQRSFLPPVPVRLLTELYHSQCSSNGFDGYAQGREGLSSEGTYFNVGSFCSYRPS